MPVETEPKTIHIDASNPNDPLENGSSEHPFDTIQEGVDAANSGDTIYVHSGTYPENVFVSQLSNLKLVGESIDNTFIVQSGQRQTVLYIQRSLNVTVQSFTIMGDYPSDEHTHGIWLHDSDNANIIENQIMNCWVALYVDNLSANNVINGNIIIDNYDGLGLGYSGGNVLRNNQMIGNRYNFHLPLAGNLSGYVNDIDTSNTVDGKPMHYLVNQHNVEIPNDAGYVAVINSTNVTVKDLTIRRNRQGVFFAFTTNSSIENVTAFENDFCVHLYRISHCEITRNEISNNNLGIVMFDSDENFINGNYVTNNTNYGISLSAYMGIGRSDGNIITGNNVSNNNVGVRVQNSSNNNISGNNITSNEYGIYLLSSFNNKFYHNSFINNTQQVHIQTSGFANFWDDAYPSGGNHWSDYIGKGGYDGDGDGIGDISYILDENNRDRYPLMNPYVPSIPVFDPSLNGYGFRNWGRSETELIPTVEELYLQLLNEPWFIALPPDVSTIFLISLREHIRWWAVSDGHCYGMVASAVHYFNHPDELPNGKPLWEVEGLPPNPQVGPPPSPYLGTIDYYQTQVVLNPLVFVKSIEIQLDLLQNDDEFDAIYSQVENSGPAIMVVYIPNYEGTSSFLHAILVYKIIDQGDGNYRVFYYDPNWGAVRQIGTFKRFDGSNGIFYYNGIEADISSAHYQDRTITEYVLELFIDMLFVNVHSPVELAITDPDEKYVGFSANGTLEYGFPAVYMNNSLYESTTVLIPNPLNGTYWLTLNGTGVGSYNLTCIYTSDDELVQLSQMGSIEKGQELEYWLSMEDQTLISEFPLRTSIIIILVLLTVAIAIYKRRLLKTSIQ